MVPGTTLRHLLDYGARHDTNKVAEGGSPLAAMLARTASAFHYSFLMKYLSISPYSNLVSVPGI